MKDALVSRMEVMSALVKEYNYRRTQDDWKGGLKLAWIEKAVNSVPAHRGKWIKQHDEYWGVVWYECSVCGQKPPNNQFGQEWHSNYCAFCGADMRGDEDDKRRSD